MTKKEFDAVQDAIETEHGIIDQIMVDVDYARKQLREARVKGYQGWMAYDSMKRAEDALERIESAMKGSG